MRRARKPALEGVAWSSSMDAEVREFYRIVSAECLAEHINDQCLASTGLRVNGNDVVLRAADLGLAGGQS